MVPLVNPANQVDPVPQVSPEAQDLLVQLDQPVHLVTQVVPEHPDLKDPKDPLDLLELQDRR